MRFRLRLRNRYYAPLLLMFIFMPSDYLFNDLSRAQGATTTEASRQASPTATTSEASPQASPSANLGESNHTLIIRGACAGKLSMCLSLFVRFFRYLSELLTKVFGAESSDVGKNCNPFGSVMRQHEHICPPDCHGECGNCWYM